MEQKEGIGQVQSIASLQVMPIAYFLVIRLKVLNFRHGRSDFPSEL